MSSLIMYHLLGEVGRVSYETPELTNGLDWLDGEPRDPPVSAPPALGLQTGVTTSVLVGCCRSN